MESRFQSVLGDLVKKDQLLNQIYRNLQSFTKVKGIIKVLKIFRKILKQNLIILYDKEMI